MRLLRKLLLALVLGGIGAVGFVATGAFASHQFPDVPTSSSSHNDIAWAKDNGIVAVPLGHAFHPNDPLLRAHATTLLHRYSGTISVVHHGGSFTNATEASNTASCPAGKRPIAGGGNTDAFNMMITDITIGPSSVTVRWETDNNASLTGTSDAWATCMPNQ
jgi:hypothetical protein